MPFFRSVSAFTAYLAWRGVETAARALPMGVCWRVGRVLGGTARVLFPSYRKLAAANITIAFGREKSPDELKALVREHFATLGANLFCSLKIPWMKEPDIVRLMDIEGAEHATAAVQAGRGFIYALSHMGAWELLSVSRLATPGTNPAAMFQRLGNERLNAHVMRARARTGCTLFDRRDGFSAPAKWLRGNGALGILVDQHAGDGGVWTPFFGRLASTTTLAALLSRRTGAPILPVSLTTAGPGRWKMTIGAPLETSQPPASPDKVTAQLNGVIEQAIRRSPADWFWVHNRWKTPNPDPLLVHYKRGMVLPDGFAEADLQPFPVLVRSPNWLGDACMAVPAVRALRRGRPDARVTVLTPAKLAGFWQQVPEVDCVLSIPAGGGIGEAARVIRASGQAFSVAVLFPNSLRSALEAWRAGIPRIIGYAGHSRTWLVDQVIPPRKRPGPIQHHIRHYLRIAWRMGANVDDPTLTDPLPAPAAPLPRAATKGKAKGKSPVKAGPPAETLPVLGICAGAEYGPAKRWPLENFAAAIRQIQESMPCQVVLFGAPGEAAMGEDLSARLDGKCENLVGKTSLDELMARLRTCDLLLTNDTGTMHLAALLGTRVVAIFGSTEPAATGPIGEGHTVLRRHVACSPCFLRECPLDFRCMTQITPESVAATVTAQLHG